MLRIHPTAYFELMSALAQCKSIEELQEIEDEIKKICDTEIKIASGMEDVRNAAFTVMIEKISAMYATKLKIFSDERAQAGLNRWTFWLMVGTFAMVVVSAVSTVMTYYKK